MMHRRQISFTAALTAISITAIISAETVTFRTVAITGELAPGTMNGVFSDLGVFDDEPGFETVFPPQIDAMGQVAFYARLSGPDIDISNDQGVWAERNGSLMKIARTGDIAPGAGDPWATLAIGTLNDSGALTVPGATLAGSPGLWTEGSGELALVVQQGDSLPGSSNPVGFVFIHPFDSAGRAILQPWLIGTPDSSEGLWVENGGQFHLVALEGGPAQAIPETGVIYGPTLTFEANNFSVWANDIGQLAYGSSLSCPAITPENDSGLWLWNAGEHALIVREGDPAPGLGPDVFIGHVGSEERPDTDPARFVGGHFLNDAGQILFASRLQGNGVNPQNDSAIWLYNEGLTLLVREGDPAPGTCIGCNPQDQPFFRDISILVDGVTITNQLTDVGAGNDIGDFLFIGSLDGDNVDSTNDSGIWGDSQSVNREARSHWRSGSRRLFRSCVQQLQIRPDARDEQSWSRRVLCSARGERC
jgi:hypothetical protein